MLKIPTERGEHLHLVIRYVTRTFHVPDAGLGSWESAEQNKALPSWRLRSTVGERQSGHCVGDDDSVQKEKR